MKSAQLASDLFVVNGASDVPAWAPVVFGVGAVALVVLVVVLARQKIQRSNQWHRDSSPDLTTRPTHPESDDDFRNRNAG